MAPERRAREEASTSLRRTCVQPPGRNGPGPDETSSVGRNPFRPAYPVAPTDEDVVRSALRGRLETHGPFVKLPDEVVRAGRAIESMEAVRERR